jgi:hypothetical protein
MNHLSQTNRLPIIGERLGILVEIGNFQREESFEGTESQKQNRRLKFWFDGNMPENRIYRVG